MLVCGDFNCSLRADGHAVGTSLFTWKSAHSQGPQHQDMGRFHKILASHSLVALNTWDAKSPPTFSSSFQASRIDFFLMRSVDVDSWAQEVKYLPNAGFLPIAGPMHCPMMCSLRKIPYRHTRRDLVSSCTYQQRMNCRLTCQQKPDEWTHFMTDMKSSWDTFWTGTCYPDTVIDDMHSALMPVFQNHFPKCAPEAPTACVTLSQAQTKWQHRHALFALKGRRLSTIFQAWFHIARFQQLKRYHQQQARMAKRQKFQDLLAEVHRASTVHDSFTVFQAINKFTPKQLKKRIRLRSATGEIADPHAAVELYRQHVHSVWAGPERIHYHCSHPPGVPFSQQELAEEIRRIPVVKSVARPYIPGIFWKHHADATAAQIFSLLEQWWGSCDFHVPTQWETGMAHLY